MTSQRMTALEQWGLLGRYLALGLIVFLAIGLSALTAASATGYLPWLTLDLRLGNAPLPYAGMALQIGMTALLVGLLFFLPTDRRMLRLEQSHREFQISMDDISNAYRLAHARDREGLFHLSSEFDGVRERLAFLRDHPDLRSLEPDVLEVAAQMSEKSRELADIYSTEKVERARTFLQQRQEEAAAFDERLALVGRTLDELRRWNQQLNVEDSVRRTQIAQLEQDLIDLLPGLEYEPATGRSEPFVLEERLATDKPNVVPITPKKV